MKFRRQLFKYLDVTGALAMLSKGTLQFTNSFYFNDPFDCHPSLIDFSSDPGGRYGDVFKDWIRAEKRNTHDRLRENTWICSLSKIKDSLLMWSHYANNHKGVCVELNMAHVIKYLDGRYGTVVNNVGIEVQYKDIVQKPDYFKNFQNYHEYQISTKGKDWEYEQEWRLYIIDPSPRYMGMPFKPKRNVTNDWKKARVYPVLGGECFEAIYLGAKISEEDLQKAINLARKINKDIKIYQMEINPEAFKLDVREIGQGA
jgi:hypothetical protein